MFDNSATAKGRGQVGIETLIIFIAMILVAAIAAGILINTAGFLQNKASATSQDSTEQVSNQVVVVSGVGQVSSTGGNVTMLNLTLMLSPGADEIDLSEATIDWIGPHGHETLQISPTVIKDPTFPPPCWYIWDCSIVRPLKDVDLSAPVLNDKSDRLQLSITLNETEAVSPAVLQPGEEATMKITTQSGSSYTYVANVPESLSSKADSAVSV